MPRTSETTKWPSSWIEDQQAEADDRDEDGHAGCSSRAASRRASASAATRSSRSRAAAPSTRASVSSTTARDVEEGDPALEERGDGDLVRRVVGARRRAASLARRAGQTEQREGVVVDRLEREREALER